MKLLIQDFFEKFLKSTDVKFKREYKLGDSEIDFIADFGGKIHGIEIKSSYSNAYLAVGQLINFSRYFSHLILVAPKDFLDKFNETIQKTNVLKQIGTIIFENGSFVETKKPTPTEYFFLGADKTKEKKKLYKNGSTKDRFTENEIKFFKKIKDEPFMVHSLVKDLNKSFGAAYYFIMMLRKLGLIEEVNIGFHPKSFKITNKLHEMLELPNQT